MSITSICAAARGQAPGARAGAVQTAERSERRAVRRAARIATLGSSGHMQRAEGTLAGRSDCQTAREVKLILKLPDATQPPCRKAGAGRRGHSLVLQRSAWSALLPFSFEARQTCSLSGALAGLGSALSSRFVVAWCVVPRGGRRSVTATPTLRHRARARRGSGTQRDRSVGRRASSVRALGSASDGAWARVAPSGALLGPAARRKRKRAGLSQSFWPEDPKEDDEAPSTELSGFKRLSKLSFSLSVLPVLRRRTLS